MEDPVEVPLNDYVTLTLNENRSSITSKESGFPVGCLRGEECEDFWKSVEDNRLKGDVCHIFERVTQHYLSQVKEQTASDLVKNELLNFLCHTGAVRLKVVNHNRTCQVQIKQERDSDIENTHESSTSCTVYQERDSHIENTQETSTPTSYRVYQERDRDIENTQESSTSCTVYQERDSHIENTQETSTSTACTVYRERDRDIENTQETGTSTSVYRDTSTNGYQHEQWMERQHLPWQQEEAESEQSSIRMGHLDIKDSGTSVDVQQPESSHDQQLRDYLSTTEQNEQHSENNTDVTPQEIQVFCASEQPVENSDTQYITRGRKRKQSPPSPTYTTTYPPEPNNQENFASMCGEMVFRNQQYYSMMRGKKRGNYQHYDNDLRIRIAKYAIENGVAMAVQYFNPMLEKPIHKSTVWSMKKWYITRVMNGEII